VGEEFGECVVFVFAAFVGGVEVGVDDGEFGESLQGAPAAAAVSLLDFHGADVGLGLIVRPGHSAAP
jgi:hypothetical protein